jgi:hypothetical protein
MVEAQSAMKKGMQNDGPRRGLHAKSAPHVELLNVSKDSPLC